MAKAHQNATPLVSICYAVAVFAGLVWAVFGTGILYGAHMGPTAHGLFERDATVMAVPIAGQVPWLGLMVGLAVYAVWQCTPTARHTQLHGRLRPWVLLVVVLNALWLQLLQRDRVGPSLLCAIGLLATLIMIDIMISRTRLCSNMDRWITRASFGLFTGWLGIIVLAELVTWIALLGPDPQQIMFKGAAAFILLILCLVLCVATFKQALGIYVNAGALWVVFWITLDRITWQEASPLFATVSTVATLLLLLCLVSALRTRIRALRSHPNTGRDQSSPN
ncbi:hypothetical protein [Glutamicibacter sp.]|uniref:hypothetical protein n=1 Tax=Glutamicibacter sp. TaxID=1931995 RepID=UPI0028BF3E00|nr:hypothetical protein [Glutamicibacter sp.]